MFQAKIEQDDHSNSMILAISHNGTAWSTIELRTPAEAIVIISKLEREVYGKQKSVHLDHAWDCMIHDGYGLCNCGANLRNTD